MLKLILHRLKAIWLPKQAAPLEWALTDKDSKVRRCKPTFPNPWAWHWS